MGRGWAWTGCIGLFCCVGCGSTGARVTRYRVDTPRVIEGSFRGAAPSQRLTGDVRRRLEADGPRIVACFDGLAARSGATEPQDVTAQVAVTIAGPMLAGLVPGSASTIVDDGLRACLDQVMSTWAPMTEVASLEVRMRVVPSARPVAPEAPSDRFVPEE